MKRKRRGNGERMRKWRENFLILPLYPPSLSISYIKICHILSQNVKYGIFVANVTKNLPYVLRENNSGSNSLRESSASCDGLICAIIVATSSNTITLPPAGNRDYTVLKSIFHSRKYTVIVNWCFQSSASAMS